MASGIKHERATKFWAIPFGLALTVLSGPKTGIFGAFAFLIGGFWLSPDLDTPSLPQKRWGIFKILWWPYQKLIPHRSIISHGPIIGTTLRLLYIILWIGFISTLLSPFGITTPTASFTILKVLIQNNAQTSIAIIIGIEASVWLHLIKDGYLIPLKVNSTKRK